MVDGNGEVLASTVFGWLDPGQRWWEGTPVNPYPLLTGAPANR